MTRRIAALSPFLLCLAGPSLLPGAWGGGSDAVVAISSRASDDYVRPRLPNGAFRVETYAFGKGGFYTGAMRDSTIDHLDFLLIAHVIAGPLAAENYIAAKDPKAARLLIMVYWGTTRAPKRPTESSAYDSLHDAIRAQNEEQITSAVGQVAAENHVRELKDAATASLLGYDSWWAETDRFSKTPFEARRQDMLEELEENRYFVVLMAYDFQLMAQHKKTKLLWETRYSIRERGNDFSRQLAAMSKDASRYFGRESGGLIHKSIPVGRVEVGTPRTMEPAPTQ